MQIARPVLASAPAVSAGASQFVISIAASGAPQRRSPEPLGFPAAAGIRWPASSRWGPRRKVLADPNAGGAPNQLFPSAAGSASTPSATSSVWLRGSEPALASVTSRHIQGAQSAPNHPSRPTPSAAGGGRRALRAPTNGVLAVVHRTTRVDIPDECVVSALNSPRFGGFWANA